MANTIQQFLDDLETRLAPTMNVDALREILTETEVHLRERATEFREVGLDRYAAEREAIAAFGDADDFVEDVAKEPVVVASPPAPRSSTTTPRDPAFQLIVAVLSLGILVFAIMTVHSAFPIFWTCLAAVMAYIGILAWTGRSLGVGRIVTLAFIGAVMFTLVGLGRFVPGGEPTMPLTEGEARVEVDALKNGVIPQTQKLQRQLQDMDEKVAKGLWPPVFRDASSYRNYYGFNPYYYMSYPYLQSFDPHLYLGDRGQAWAAYRDDAASVLDARYKDASQRVEQLQLAIDSSPARRIAWLVPFVTLRTLVLLAIAIGLQSAGSMAGAALRRSPRRRRREREAHAHRAVA